jgi:hypothetical protein
MKTRVLIKHKHDAHWADPEVGAYPDEEKLKTILRDDPALFPFGELHRPVVMVDEFTVPVGETDGFVDLVGVSASGGITIVECKLATSPDIKRRLVGQLVEYAAGMWRMSYDEFDAEWQALTRPARMTDAQWKDRRRPPLEEDVAHALGDEHAFDRGAFRQAVQENLQNGNFTLVVAVDTITEALEGSILYLSEHTGPTARVVAMELGYLAHGDVEVLIPRTFGLEVAERKSAAPSSPRMWDTTSFDATLQKEGGEWALNLATSLREWAVAPEIGLEVRFGQGRVYGTEAFALRLPDGTQRTLFTLWSNAWVELALGNLKGLRAYRDHAARLEVLQALSRIEGQARKEAQADGWPQFQFDVLREPAKLEDFKALIREVVSRIKEPEALLARPVPTGQSAG